MHLQKNQVNRCCSKAVISPTQTLLLFNSLAVRGYCRSGMQRMVGLSRPHFIMTGQFDRHERANSFLPLRPCPFLIAEQALKIPYSFAQHLIFISRLSVLARL